MSRPRTHGALLAVGMGAALAILLVAHQLLQLGDRSMLGLALNNAAHTPFFIVLTLLVHGLGFTAALAFVRRPPVLVGIMALLAAATEVLQVFTGRSASIEDWGRDMLGVAAAVSLIQALALRKEGARRWPGVLVLGGLVAVLGFTSVFDVLARNYRRDALAPQLLPMEPGLLAESARIRGTWQVEQDPDTGAAVLRLELDRPRFPGLTLREPIPDWRNYNWLVLDGHAAPGHETPLTLRLETFTDRGTEHMLQVLLMEERQALRVPLRELAPERGRVRNLFLYAEHPGIGDTVFLHGIRLE